MLHGLLSMAPPSALEIALVLALSLFIGLEREEHKQHEAAYAFGGIRSFPLIGLVSYTLALISGPQVVPWGIGLAVVGGFMLLSYHHKLGRDPAGGLTTEISALATYVLGGLVEHRQYWIAATVGVLSVLLLELKKGLEGLTRYLASNEIVTVAKFLVLAVVILPILPDRDLTRFHVSPFRTWLVVVAVSGVSFASYVLQRLSKKRGGVILSALLGGAYSSTVTTVVLARQARTGEQPNLFSGSILAASGVMYVRLVLLLAFFNGALAAALAPSFVGLGFAGAVTGWLISRRADGAAGSARPSPDAKNPLELRTAFLFAIVFVAAVALTNLARQWLGRVGVYSLAAVLGVTDVDPFVLGLAQASPATTSLRIAVPAIVIAAASNNVMKALYAYFFADRTTGRRALILLGGLAAFGLVPLVWV